MNRTIRLALVAITCAVAVPANGGVTAAQEPPPQTPPDQTTPADDERPTWAVEPAGTAGLAERTYFIYTLPPGARLVDTVAVSNLDAEPLTVAIYPADAYNTSKDGAFALRNAEDPKVGVGGWIRLGVQERTIPPQTRAEIPFELTVPNDAEPGDHAGALLAAKVELEAGGGGDGVDVQLRRRVGARIYVRVEGPLDPALSVTRLAIDDHQPIVPFVTGAGGVDVNYTVTNTGNVRLAPTAHVELVGPFGMTVHRSEAETLPELLPGGSVDRHVKLEELPPLGRLSLRVIVTSDEADTRSSHTIWAVPWVWLAVVALILARWQWRRRRRRRAEQADVSAPEPQPEEQPTV
ncbi:MAG TPA: DUF916 domain-containing protein [Acidimicrobiales bacterium]|nr:DUF916 domain-containing protein [Acidimicrobiales bacterium]